MIGRQSTSSPGSAPSPPPPLLLTLGLQAGVGIVSDKMFIVNKVRWPVSLSTTMNVTSGAMDWRSGHAGYRRGILVKIGRSPGTRAAG